VSRARPAAQCFELSFEEACPLPPAAHVALEDYARVLTGAAAAEVVDIADGRVAGVHLCGVPAPLSAASERDILDFARELKQRPPSGSGLGWS
jgi:hypothetical protein